MADHALNLDDFLSRFQLLRPQPSRHALNQRQAAVLVPIVRVSFSAGFRMHFSPPKPE